MIILGIESTADETAICLLENGLNVLDHKIASSLELHKKTKGIVPEISARAHLENIFKIVHRKRAFNFGNNGRRMRNLMNQSPGLSDIIRRLHKTEGYEIEMIFKAEI